MKRVKVCGSKVKSKYDITVTGSKSESNRLLILQSIFKNISIKNLSSSDDTQILKKSLDSKEDNLNVGHAGTAMRFLTAYLATLENKKFLLSGSKRMNERPIGVLVEALRDLGFNIRFIKNKGFPPVQILGGKNCKNKVKLKSTVSSQYISALMLIAPSLENGLEIELDGKIISRPYINMTLSILIDLGVSARFTDNSILINAKKNRVVRKTFEVESCWSSVSYFFSIVALSNNIELSFKNYKSNSYQGDINVSNFYELFGVKSKFKKNKLILSRDKNFNYPKKINIDLSDNPDLAQTIIVTAFGLNIPTKLRGLSTLKIKETDRLIAIYNEINALGGNIEIGNESIEIFKSDKEINNNHVIQTYQDHRMALAFAPLSLICPIEISNPNVVSKSFPEFWKILKEMNFSIDYYN